MPDVNLLIYAHRFEAHGHVAYRQWVEELGRGGEPFALSVLVAVAFVRIMTNAAIYADPMPLPQALAAIDTIAAHENCRLLAPGPRHWRLVSELCRSTRATGKRVADAQHAATAIEHGCEWVTRDGDFRAFEDHGLRWRHLVL